VPAGRLGHVDDVVAMVRYLLSDAGAYVTGQVLTIDGGLQA
jgi:3-oxoacyl-[acyl-carrier protein] reductase